MKPFARFPPGQPDGCRAPWRRAAGVIGTGIFVWQMGFFVLGGAASAQQAEESGALLRGSVGSSEATPVFPDAGPLFAAEAAQREEPALKRGAPPARQSQLRAVPAVPAPRIADPATSSLLEAPAVRGNVPEPRVQTGVPRNGGDDPFAPLGLRVGSWLAYGSIEQSLGYSTNLARTSKGESGAFSETAIDLSLQSDWSRHAARIDASGTYRRSLGSDIEIVPSAAIDGELRLDLIDGVEATAEAGYAFTTESLTSTTLTGTETERPGVHEFTGAVGIERTERKLLFALRGSVGRTVYEDAATNAGTLSQEDRNNTLYQASGRLGYAVSPALIPFVEASVGTRHYDLEEDRNGENRDSHLYGVAAGIAVDLGEKLSGEIAAGYEIEDFQDERFEDLAGITLNGTITWSPVRETTVTLRAETDFSGATTSGESGSIVQLVGIDAGRRVNDRLRLEANAEAEISYDPDAGAEDFLWRIGAGFEYWLNRTLALTGAVAHAELTSDDGASDYTESTIKAGVKLQR